MYGLTVHFDGTEDAILLLFLVLKAVSPITLEKVATQIVLQGDWS
jgi:hypothetical protein